MGSELSCPCGDRSHIETNPNNQNDPDIIEEVMKGKLSPNDITYQYNYKQTKICLIKTEELEGFFSNRKILKVLTKQEINHYYDIVFLTNFMAISNQAFVIMQYTPGMQDKSFGKGGYSSFLNNRNKKRNSTAVDYSTNYKVEKINLVSIENRKVIEQIMNDLIMNVKKDYLFYGIVNDSYDDSNYYGGFNNNNNYNGYKTPITPTPTPTPSTSRVAAPRDFKMLYKRSLLKENIDVKYTIKHFAGVLDRDIIDHYIDDESSKYMKLKAIMIDSALDDNILKKNYYFIFEESKIVPSNGYDHLVIELEQGNNSNKMMIQDMAVKVNDFQKSFKLSCVVCDDKKIYMVSYADNDEIHEETPFDFETPDMD